MWCRAATRPGPDKRRRSYQDFYGGGERIRTADFYVAYVGIAITLHVEVSVPSPGDDAIAHGEAPSARRLNFVRADLAGGLE